MEQESIESWAETNMPQVRADEIGRGIESAKPHQSVEIILGRQHGGDAGEGVLHHVSRGAGLRRREAVARMKRPVFALRVLA